MLLDVSDRYLLYYYLLLLILIINTLIITIINTLVCSMLLHYTCYSTIYLPLPTAAKGSEDSEEII